jgi:predicted glycoside hydrolase/deacetylase ChbG (UPF0249 family)
MTAPSERAGSRPGPRPPQAAPSAIILCADDYAMTEGVSRAIGELAAAQRLSATSVMVTSPHWPAGAPRLAVHRGHLGIGLHLNLTLGHPLGPMPRLAPSGALPSLERLMAWSCFPLLVQAEVRAEIERQLDRFETGLRFPPDHVDGHQHVHVLPAVRGALLDALARRYGGRPPLVRDPTDRLSALGARSTARAKAISVRLLASGFARAARRRGLPVNDSFAGFSDFRTGTPYADELKSALREPGRRHLVMCHPGHPDAELARLDPVVERRRMEYDALMRDVSLPSLIWRPARKADGPSLAWPRLRD